LGREVRGLSQVPNTAVFAEDLVATRAAGGGGRKGGRKGGREEGRKGGREEGEKGGREAKTGVQGLRRREEGVWSRVQGWDLGLRACGTPT